jgi:hypothetical protein
MMMILGSCPKCHGAMERQQNNDCGLAKVFEWHCFNCGNVISSEQMKEIIYLKNERALSLNTLKNKEEPEVKTEMILQPITDMPNTDGMGPKAKGLILRPWYEKHKADILADIERLGKESTRKRWQIPSQTFLNLRRDWGQPIDARYAHHKPKDEELAPAKPAEKMTENMPEQTQKIQGNDKNPQCYYCGSENVDPEMNYCYGCQQLVCSDCIDIEAHINKCGSPADRIVKRKVKVAEVTVRIHPVIMPPYPPFDPSLPEGVLCKWLETYGRIVVEGK